MNDQTVVTKRIKDARVFSVMTYGKSKGWQGTDLAIMIVCPAKEYAGRVVKGFLMEDLTGHPKLLHKKIFG